MSGPPVLLVHGFASSFARNWVDHGWVDLLREAGREVIGVDLLGHGDAPKPQDPEAYRDLGARVADALPGAGVVDAVGFSLGAGVLLQVAASAPERFGRICVGGVGANLLRAGDPAPVARAVLAGRAEGNDHEAVHALARFASSPGNDPGALAACLLRPAPPLRPGDLAGLTCPVLVVLGDRDFAGPADPLVEALPDAGSILVRGLDHFATPRDPRFVGAALDWVGAA